MPSSQCFQEQYTSETEIQQLWRETEKVEIAPERIGTVSEMSYGGWSGTETVRDQGCNLDDYPGGHTRRSYKNPIHRRLIKIIHERAKGDVPTLRSRNKNLVIKHVNEVN